MRDFAKSLFCSPWRMSMLGVEQITKMAMFPVTNVLANLGGPFRSVTSAAAQQIDTAFQTMIQSGEELQGKTVDLLFDVFTLQPLRESLERIGILGRQVGAGYQGQPELEYLEALNDAGPAPTSLIVLVLATQYANLNRQAQGIERFETYLKQYDAQLLPRQRAVYLSCLALLRAGHVQQLPLWQLWTIISQIGRVLAELQAAKDLTATAPDFSDNNEKLIARWISGLLHAQLPPPFGDRNVAFADLTWCDETINASTERKTKTFNFLREVYYNLALLYREQGNQEKAQHYLRLSTYENFDKKQIVLATPYATGGQGQREDIKHVNEPVKDLFPGKVFTLAGFDMSEFNFVISKDGTELIAIDAGSREDTARAAYQFLENYYRENYGTLPKLTTLFVTHAHWDHIGGHHVYKQLAPDLEMYSRFDYRVVRERSAKQPPPYHWYLGEAFTRESVATYEPTVVVGKDPVGTETTLVVGDAVHQVFERVIGGSRIQFILPQGGGGETEDGMMVYFPEYRVLHVGDFLVPWIGAPYLPEGDIDSLLGTMDLLASLEPQPEHLLHGHGPLTLFFGTVQTVKKFRPHLEWLKNEVLKAIYAYKNRPTIQEMNLFPDDILAPSQADVQLPYLVYREVVTDRLYRQMTGYWGPQLEGVDYLSQQEIGAAFARYMQLSEAALAAGIARMIDNGDHELAGQTVEWALTQYPDSTKLKEVRERAFLKLKEKWQQLNVFKFVMYSEHINNPTRQLE
jgi:glyoxylase-like metal-dependent hydrolase (beta-lactamase superfamily II)